MIRRIVERHAEEAAFLWELRDAAATGTRHTLVALADLDERVEAHLDGLRVAGPGAWEVCAELLPLEEPGEVFVVAALALHLGEHEKLAAVLDAAGLDRVRARGIASAIGWTPVDRIGDTLEAFLTPGAPPALRRLGIAGAALHRTDPGPSLGDSLFSGDASLKARALRAVGELGRLDLAAVLRPELGAADDGVRFWAAWSLALLGDAHATEILWGFAEQGGRYAAPAVAVAARATSVAAARRWLDRLEARPDLGRVALLGAVALGDPACLPRLFADLRDPRMARLAGHGIATLAGIDGQAPGFVGKPPEGFAAGPSDNPADEDVAMDADEALPWPDAAALEAECRRRALPVGVRHLAGAPTSAAVVERVLRDGSQAQRLSAALEKCLMRPGVPLQEVRAPGFRQRGVAS